MTQRGTAHRQLNTPTQASAQWIATEKRDHVRIQLGPISYWLRPEVAAVLHGDVGRALELRRLTLARRGKAE